jgi:hypothetical protein
VAQRDVGGLARLVTLRLMPTISAFISSSEVVSVSSATSSAASTFASQRLEVGPGEDGVVARVAGGAGGAVVSASGSENRSRSGEACRRASARLRAHADVVPSPPPSAFARPLKPYFS